MIQLLGKDHSVSVEEREAFIKVCACLRRGPHVYLQTCNRVEIYKGDGLADPQIVEHLFRVTSGLESRMVGERHIQGQVKRAYIESVNGQHISSGLHRLFQAALHVGKKVRTGTEISKGALTHSMAVIELLSQECRPLDEKRVLVVGVHKTNENILKYLHACGCKSVVITNRTEGKAKETAQSFDFRSIAFHKRVDALNEADILITATSSDEPIFLPQSFSAGRSITVVDIAVPRDVDPLAGKIPGVTLFNVEDVEARIDQNLSNRKSEMLRAENIIRQEVERFSNTLTLETIPC